MKVECLLLKFPKRPEHDYENTDIVATSSNSNRLVTKNSGNFGWFSSVSYQLLASQCDGVLRSEDIEQPVAGKQKELIIVTQHLQAKYVRTTDVTTNQCKTRGSLRQLTMDAISGSALTSGAVRSLA